MPGHVGREMDLIAAVRRDRSPRDGWYRRACLFERIDQPAQMNRVEPEAAHRSS